MRGRSRAVVTRKGATACRPASAWWHGVACPATAGTVPKGTKASGDAEAKASGVNTVRLLGRSSGKQEKEKGIL